MSEKSRIGVYVLVAVGLAASANRATAVNIPLSNSDFESVVVADPDGINTTVTGWTGGVTANGFRATFDPGAVGGAVFAGENNYWHFKGKAPVRDLRSPIDST